MSYDHKLHVAQEQYDSREPHDSDGSEPCEECLRPRSAHLPNMEWCSPDAGDWRTFLPLTEESERELRAAMRGDL